MHVENTETSKTIVNIHINIMKVNLVGYTLPELGRGRAEPKDQTLSTDICQMKRGYVSDIPPTALIFPHLGVPQPELGRPPAEQACPQSGAASPGRGQSSPARSSWAQARGPPWTPGLGPGVG